MKNVGEIAYRPDKSLSKSSIEKGWYVYSRYGRDCKIWASKIFLLSLSLHDEGPTLEILDFTICIGSTPTFFYLYFYLNTAYAAHYG